MPADERYMEYVMQLLEPIGGVASRAMFGGYGIFHDGDMFALISKSTLYFKVDESNRARYEDAGSARFQRMPYFEVPAEVLDEAERLREWAAISVTVGHATAKRKK